MWNKDVLAKKPYVEQRVLVKTACVEQRCSSTRRPVRNKDALLQDDLCGTKMLFYKTTCVEQRCPCKGYLSKTKMLFCKTTSGKQRCSSTRRLVLVGNIDALLC